MKGKRIIMMAAAAMTMAFGWHMTVCAQPAVMPDGTVFDAEFYAQANPDVAAVFGMDADVLYQHYVLFGKAEGRAPQADAGAVAALDYEKTVAELTSAERAAAGIPALAWDDTLGNAAGLRAKELVQLFSHARPGGGDVFGLLGNPNCYMGENIAMGYKTPGDVVNGWMNSEGHRRNILDSHYTKIGVGYYQDEKGTTYWCQVFSS